MHTLTASFKNKLCVHAFVKIFVLVGLCAILLVFVLFQPIHSPLVIRMPCIPLGGGSDYTQVLYLLPPGTCIRFFISTLPKNELPNNELKWRQVIYFTDYGPDIRSSSAPRSLTAYIFPPGSSTPLGVLSGNFSLSILAEKFSKVEVDLVNSGSSVIFGVVATAGMAVDEYVDNSLVLYIPPGWSVQAQGNTTGLIPIQGISNVSLEWCVKHQGIVSCKQGTNSDTLFFSGNFYVMSPPFPPGEMQENITNATPYTAELVYEIQVKFDGCDELNYCNTQLDPFEPTITNFSQKIEPSGLVQVNASVNGVEKQVFSFRLVDAGARSAPPPFPHYTLNPNYLASALLALAALVVAAKTSRHPEHRAVREHKTHLEARGERNCEHLLRKKHNAVGCEASSRRKWKAASSPLITVVA